MDDNVIRRALVDDGERILCVLKALGYSPQHALATLLSAVGAVCIGQGYEHLLDSTVNDLASVAFKLRRNEMQERVQ